MLWIKFGLKTSLRDFIIKATLHNLPASNCTLFSLMLVYHSDYLRYIFNAHAYIKHLVWAWFVVTDSPKTLSDHIRPAQQLTPTLGVHTAPYGTANIVSVMKPEGSSNKTPYMRPNNERSLSNMLSHKTQTYMLMIQVCWDVTLCQ